MQSSQRRPRPSLTHAAHAASLASRAPTASPLKSKDNTPQHSLRESYDGVVMPRSPQLGRGGGGGGTGGLGAAAAAELGELAPLAEDDPRQQQQPSPPAKATTADTTATTAHAAGVVGGAGDEGAAAAGGGAAAAGGTAGGSASLGAGSSLDAASTLTAVLAAFGARVGALAKQAEPAGGGLDARAALPPLVAMLRLLPGDATGAQAEAANAVAALMADSAVNRQLVFESGGLDALLTLVGAPEATVAMGYAAAAALRVLVQSPEHCTSVAAHAAAMTALTRFCACSDVRDSHEMTGERMGGALPAAAVLRALAESGSEARGAIRGHGGCDALASLVLLCGGDWPGASKAAGYALYALMQEEPAHVLDAIEKVCKNEAQFGKTIESCCPELLSVLQKRVGEKLQKAIEGSDVKHLQEMLAYAHGVMLPSATLKDAKSKFRGVMQRQEEKRMAAERAGGASAMKAPSSQPAAGTKPALLTAAAATAGGGTRGPPAASARRDASTTSGRPGPSRGAKGTDVPASARPTTSGAGAAGRAGGAAGGSTTGGGGIGGNSRGAGGVPPRRPSTAAPSTAAAGGGAVGRGGVGASGASAGAASGKPAPGAAAAGKEAAAGGGGAASRAGGVAAAPGASGSADAAALLDVSSQLLGADAPPGLLEAGRKLAEGLAMAQGGLRETLEAMSAERAALATRMDAEASRSAQLAAEVAELKSALEAKESAATEAAERIAALEAELEQQKQQQPPQPSKRGGAAGGAAGGSGGPSHAPPHGPPAASEGSELFEKGGGAAGGGKTSGAAGLGGRAADATPQQLAASMEAAKSAALGQMRATRDAVREVEREAAREATLLAGAGAGLRPSARGAGGGGGGGGGGGMTSGRGAASGVAVPEGLRATTPPTTLAMAALAGELLSGKALGAVEEGAPDDELDLASMSDGSGLSASFREWGTARRQ